MGRPRRHDAIGARSHVTHRGNDRRAVFTSDDVRLAYLRTLRRVADREGLTVIAWCLMTTHVHLVVRTDAEGALSRAIGIAHQQFARWLNVCEDRIDHVWGARFSSVPMDGRHFRRAIQYVELNPVAAGLVGEAADWSWSSAAFHVGRRERDPLVVRPDDWFQESPGEWARTLEALAALHRREPLPDSPASEHWPEALETAVSPRSTS